MKNIKEMREESWRRFLGTPERTTCGLVCYKKGLIHPSLNPNERVSTERWIGVFAIGVKRGLESAFHLKIPQGRVGLDSCSRQEEGMKGSRFQSPGLPHEVDTKYAGVFPISRSGPHVSSFIIRSPSQETGLNTVSHII